jgi:hypothetical protein
MNRLKMYLRLDSLSFHGLDLEKSILVHMGYILHCLAAKWYQRSFRLPSKKAQSSCAQALGAARFDDLAERFWSELWTFHDFEAE